MLTRHFLHSTGSTQLLILSSPCYSSHTSASSCSSKHLILVASSDQLHDLPVHLHACVVEIHTPICSNTRMLACAANDNSTIGCAARNLVEPTTHLSSCSIPY